MKRRGERFALNLITSFEERRMKHKAWLALAAVLFFGLLGWTVKGQRQRPAVQSEWEYRIIYVPGVHGMSEKRATNLARRGGSLSPFNN
jgi:hypothetical protein